MTDRTDPALTRREALRGLGSVAAATALTGCSAAALPGDGGEQLRYATVLPPVTVDPVEADDAWSAKVSNLVFRGLYAYDGEMELRPVIAADAPTVSDDGRRYTVDLREDATFQNGRSVTASDVRYSFEAPAAEDAPTRWQVSAIASVAAVDERTVEFRLREPYPGFEATLTRNVVPESVRAGNAEAFGTDPNVTVGSGPYRLQTFSAGSYAALERWDDFWGEPSPAIDRVKLANTHAGLARTMALKTGQSDVVERVQPKLRRATRKIPSASVVGRPGFTYAFLAFNCSDGPAADPRVREAVDYLFSMDSFVDHVVGDAGTRQYGPLPAPLAEAWELPVSEWAGIPHERNVDRAKELFAAADVSSWSPKIAVPHDDKMREKLGATVVRGLKRAGFRRSRVVKYRWPEFRERVTSGNASDYAMYVGMWTGAPDPDRFLYPLFHYSALGRTNGTYYSDPAVMRRLEAARRTADRAERRRSYEAAVGKLLEQRVHIPAFTLYNTFGVKRRVENFRPHPLAESNPRLLGPDGPLELAN